MMTGSESAIRNALVVVLSVSAVTFAALALAGCEGASTAHADHDDDDEDRHEGAKKPEAHEDDEGVVHVSAEALEKNNIRVAAADAGRLGGGVTAPAEVTFLPDAVAHVTLLVAGRITSVRAKLGEQVKAGQTLAVIESAELSEAQGASAQAQAALDVARKTFERQKELRAAGIGTQRTYDDAEAQLRRAEADVAAADQRKRVYGGGGGAAVFVTAPIGGEIVERHATVGEVVDPQEPLFLIADLSKVAVSGKIYEKDIAGVKLGAAARLTLQAYPGESWQGTLDYVSPHLDEKTRTSSVRMTLDNPARSLKPGLFGTLAILGADDAPPRAIVPAAAVQRTKDGDVVFVPGTEANSFRMTPIAAGARRDGHVEIVSGLAPGQPLVVSGAFVLKSELLKGELSEGHAH